MGREEADHIVLLPSNPSALDSLLSDLNPDQLVLISDQQTEHYCLPLFISHYVKDHSCHTLTIPSGEAHKTLQTVERIWKELYRLNVSRNALVLLLGGGMLLDLAGFAAATFKRGVPMINIPTTLLAAVDASVGGKRGFNFMETKNMIGCFQKAVQTWIEPQFFTTLPQEEILSGYAEIIKHALLEGREELATILKIDDPLALTAEEWGKLVLHSIQTKRRIVSDDPYEKGPRKMLNLGHTFGHALESYFIHTGHPPIPHGYAVAAGLIMELFLSHQIYGYPSQLLYQVANYIRERFPLLSFPCKDNEIVVHYMKQDKKNRGNQILAALLRSPGEYAYDTALRASDCLMAMDYYKEIYGL